MPKPEPALTRETVRKMLADLAGALPREDCATCDCFQGFLTQLELDATEDVSEEIAPYKVPGSVLHGCLGCDPCPPSAAFTAYLRAKV